MRERQRRPAGFLVGNDMRFSSRTLMKLRTDFPHGLCAARGGKASELGEQLLESDQLDVIDSWWNTGRRVCAS